MNPNPGCIQDDCLFKQEGPAFVTMANYSPVYDKNGNNVNVDGNSSYQDIRCVTCGRQWKATTRYGSTVYKETK